MSLSRSQHGGNALRKVMTWRASAHDAFQAVIVSALGGW